MGEGKCREKCARSANPSHDIPVGVGGLGYVRLCRCRRRWRKWDFGLILFAFKLRGQTLRMPSLSALLLRLLTMHCVPRYFSSRWFWQNALSLAMKEKIIRCSIDSTNNVAMFFKRLCVFVSISHEWNTRKQIVPRITVTKRITSPQGKEKKEIKSLERAFPGRKVAAQNVQNHRQRLKTSLRR